MKIAAVTSRLEKIIQIQYYFLGFVSWNIYDKLW